MNLLVQLLGVSQGNVEKISSLSSEGLLTFIGIGVAIFIFSESVKINYRLTSFEIQRQAVIARLAYRACKQIAMWGILYLVSAIFLLGSSLPLCNPTKSIALFNFSFLLTFWTSIIILLIILKMYLIENVLDWFMAEIIR